MTGTRKKRMHAFEGTFVIILKIMNSVSYRCMKKLQACRNCDLGHCFVPLRDSGGMVQNVIIHVGKLSINHNG